jgi:hypothetical protein
MPQVCKLTDWQFTSRSVSHNKDQLQKAAKFNASIVLTLAELPATGTYELLKLRSTYATRTGKPTMTRG